MLFSTSPSGIAVISPFCFSFPKRLHKTNSTSMWSKQAPVAPGLCGAAAPYGDFLCPSRKEAQIPLALAGAAPRPRSPAQPTGCSPQPGLQGCEPGRGGAAPAFPRFLRCSLMPVKCRVLQKGLCVLLDRPSQLLLAVPRAPEGTLALCRLCAPLPRQDEA